MRLLVGLGGNQGDVTAAFSTALAALARRVGLLARSGVWRSEAEGPVQPVFLNAAVLVGTDAHPCEILELCLGIEAEAGRRRDPQTRWGPRPLDIDLLVVPGLVLLTPGLELPHPRLAARRFALAPAAEIAPGWPHPRLHRTLADLARSDAVIGQRCDRVGELLVP